MKIFNLILLLSFVHLANAQSGSLMGRVSNSSSNEEVPFAVIEIIQTKFKTLSQVDGKFKIDSIPGGVYNLNVKAIGFYEETIFDIEISPAAPKVLEITLRELADTLGGVTITANPFNRPEESPVSLKTLNATEIKRYPGGNRDISKVIQSLPGVASTPSFRNDIIIRGGAPNENRFYLDGIEVPNINHFATQGSSGGPVGMINVNYIREVDFYSGSFPADRGNALSSVMEFKQRDGNTEKHTFSGTVGASDFGLGAEGPISDKGNYLFSVRRSYLQFLFQALQLPFLPTYNDAQFKIKYYLSDKDEISVIGLGAIDDFVLNLDANETEEQQYLLDNIPVYQQWNYTLGGSYRHFGKNGYSNLVLSRNVLNNCSFKYEGNDDSQLSNKILDYKSIEAENKLRWERKLRINDWKITYGAGAENVRYSNETYLRKASNQAIQIFDFESDLMFNKYSVFGQLSKVYGKDRFTWSAGLRTDISDYSTLMLNPIDQLSPRIAISAKLLPKLFLNAGAGRYYQLPAYTVLGYRDSLGTLVNKVNKVSYIGSDQLSGGIEYLPKKSLRITVEGFVKNYSKYPFLLKDSVSLANLGADFGVIGNAPVKSISKGLARGVEVLIQQKLNKGFYGLLAYTFVYSDFTDKDDKLIPSAWDNRHVVNVSAGKSFKNGWEIGLKWRFLGGAPYTPYDVDFSSLQSVWDISGQGILDYDQLNSKRLPSTHQLDVRVDKKIYFKKWMLEFYFDIQNIYNKKTRLPSYLSVVRDDMGNPVTDPADPSRYLVKYLDNISGTVLPTLGLQIEF